MNRFSFEQARYRDLSRAQQRDIMALDRRYLRSIFPEQDTGVSAGRSDADIVRLAADIARLCPNPNRGVGGNLARSRQAYARSVSVLAIEHTDDGPILAGHVSVADNTSSRHAWPVGPVERQLKLRVPEIAGRQLTGHRFIRYALAAIEPELLEQIADNPNRANITDGMIARGMSDRDPRQPIAIYPWGEEEALKAELGAIRVENQVGEDDNVFAFGRDELPVHQERWVGSHDNVTRGIAYKEDADWILAAAGVQLVESDYGATFEVIAA